MPTSVPDNRRRCFAAAQSPLIGRPMGRPRAVGDAPGSSTHLNAPHEQFRPIIGLAVITMLIVIVYLVIDRINTSKAKDEHTHSAITEKKPSQRDG